MKFKKDAIKPDMVIHCPKEEDARELYRYCGIEFYRHTWDTHKDDTCYHVCGIDNIQGIGYGSSKYYLKRGFDITEFSDLIEPDGESESANFIKSGEIIAKGISKAIKDAESSTENSTDTSTGMTNQRAIEILSDYIERNEHIIHDPETEAIRIAISALVEKEANKNTEKVNVLMDKYNQAKKPDEMNAVEVLEWSAKADCHVLAKTFGGWRDVDDILRQFTANEILNKITAYEASRKEKPVELEWVNICKDYRTDVEYGDQVLLMKKELPDGGRKIPAENLLKEAITIYGKDCYATVERRCRVKGGA